MAACRLRRVAGFGRLEVLLVLAVLALVFQVFPAAWFSLLGVLDIRNWPRQVWMALNVLAVLALFVIRFGPTIFERQRYRRPAPPRPSATGPNHGQGDWRKLDPKEQRELFDRMKAARNKQVI